MQKEIIIQENFTPALKPAQGSGGLLIKSIV